MLIRYFGINVNINLKNGLSMMSSELLLNWIVHVFSTGIASIVLISIIVSYGYYTTIRGIVFGM